MFLGRKKKRYGEIALSDEWEKMMIHTNNFPKTTQISIHNLFGWLFVDAFFLFFFPVTLMHENSDK